MSASPLLRSPRGESPPEGAAGGGEAPLLRSPRGESPEGAAGGREAPLLRSPRGESPEGAAGGREAPLLRSPRGESPEGAAGGREAPLLRSPRGESPEGAAGGREAPGRRQDGGGEEEDDLMGNDTEDALQLERYMRDRRRAKSLPAYPGHVCLLEEPGIDDGNNGGRKRRVTFADSLGLDLASVKHFSRLEDPQIPRKVLQRLTARFPPRRQQQLLQEADLDGLCASFQSSSRLTAQAQQRRLVPRFLLVAGEELEARVRTSRVALENVTVTQFDVRGQIRVFTSGDCPWKEVGVRYTFNDWLSSVDAQALPVPVGSFREPTIGECFAFTMYTPPPFVDTGSAVHLAVYLRSEEGEFWDNNHGQNYTMRYHHCAPGV